VGNDGSNAPHIVIIQSPTSSAKITIFSIHFLHKLAQNANFPLDSVMLSEHGFECVYFVDVGGERRLRLVELGLQFDEKCRGGGVDGLSGS
jgi:hypothetical protein